MNVHLRARACMCVLTTHAYISDANHLQAHNLNTSPSSRHILSVAVDKEVIVWDPRTHAPLSRLRDPARHRPEDALTCALWDPAGPGALVAAGARLRAWPCRPEWAGPAPPGWARHEAEVVAAVGNSDSDCVLTLDRAGRALVWDLADGGPAAALALRGPGGAAVEATAAAADAGGRRLLVGTAGGDVLVYRCGPALAEYLIAKLPK
jgi:WD40 repeat protein